MKLFGRNQKNALTLSQAREALDNPIQSAPRFAIAAALASVEDTDYQTLKDALDMSYSLMTKHITILEEARIVEVTKTFVGRTPVTRLKLTDEGRKAYNAHLAALDRLVQGLAG